MIRQTNRKTGVAKSLLRRAFTRSIVLSGLSIALISSPTAKAQIGGGPGGFQAEQKVGVTLYQVSGFNGVIYLKKVPQITGTGDYIGDKLDYIGSMNTSMKWLVKYNLPPGNTFVSLPISAHTQGASVSPATADSWDGKTMIDKVSVKPWSMVNVLKQCEQQMKNPDGSYKSSANFDLQPGSSERVLAQGFSKHPNAGPGSTQKHSATGYPKTRVQVFVLDVRSGRQPQRPAGWSQQERRVLGLESFGTPSRNPKFPSPSTYPTRPTMTNLIPGAVPNANPVRRPQAPSGNRVPNLLGRYSRDIPVRKDSQQQKRQLIAPTKVRTFSRR